MEIIGAAQSGHNLQEGRLAGTVLAEDAKALTRRNAQRQRQQQIVQRDTSQHQLARPLRN